MAINSLTMRTSFGAALPPLVKNDRVLDEPLRKRIGARLKALRVEQNLDQLEVARRAEVSVGTLQTIERATRENRDSNIDKVARILGTSLAALEAKPHVDPTDPILKGLNREDLEIARAYHDASSSVRHQARQLLRDRDPQTLPTLTPGEAAVRAERIARLTPERQQLIDEIIAQFDILDQDDVDAS